MLWLLAIPLLVVPMVELWVSVQLGVSLTTVSVWCLLTAGAGWRFARRENLSLWTDLESDIQNGRLPTIEGVDTMLLLLGGWGLIVPGLLTDIAGGLLLFGPLRRTLTDYARRTLSIRFR